MPELQLAIPLRFSLALDAPEKMSRMVQGPPERLIRRKLWQVEFWLDLQMDLANVVLDRRISFELTDRPGDIQ